MKQVMIKKRTKQGRIRPMMLALLALACLTLSGCDANVGVGLSVGVPVGNHGHISVGTGRYWY